MKNYLIVFKCILFLFFMYTVYFIWYLTDSIDSKVDITWKRVHLNQGNYNFYEYEFRIIGEIKYIK